MDLLGGLAKTHAADGALLPDRRRQRLRLAAAEWFCQRAVDLLGLVPLDCGISKAASPGRRDVCRAGAGLIGALAVACFVKAFAIVFLGNSRSDTRPMPTNRALDDDRADVRARPLCCFVIGLFPQAVAPVLDRADRVWIAGHVPSRRLSLADLAPLSSVSRIGMAAGGRSASGRRLAGVAACERGWSNRSAPGAAATPRRPRECNTPARRWPKYWSACSPGPCGPRSRLGRSRDCFPKPASYASEIDDVVLDEVMLPASRRSADWLYWFRWFSKGASRPICCTFW